MQLTDLGLVSILSDTCELVLTWGEHHEHMGTLTRMEPHMNIAEPSQATCSTSRGTTAAMSALKRVKRSGRVSVREAD